ncbi:hypothetical protein MCAG_02311 [Micromonospora sp. ATCC 39149]|uniref:hypothetical protein n=1 Tax=Micromonospora sp. (strain ATCC 39149 / NRRL 15099 / SCC 1413) TaxID=219305 RepID=UPI0001A51363|nr:hypothetical protein [Micromonospora sp. ATCC 39149]EEP71984.1 hypothetical protein MCAG_02311 [Micromonospora sp. ATCC 39149]
MTTDDEQADDPRPVAWVPAEEIAGQLPFDRLDYGDVEQLAEMADALAVEEPVVLVDEPIRIRRPYERPRRRRDQPPLPT